MLKNLKKNSSSFGTSNDSDEYQLNSNRAPTSSGHRMKSNQALISKFKSQPMGTSIFRADSVQTN